MDFYEPTILFRQNAIRRQTSHEDGESLKSPYSSSSNNSSSSWLLNSQNKNDSQMLNKVCSLDRVSIKSNYWKIPDTNMNLTALAINDQAAASPLLAISSANADNNLFIYELDSFNRYLTHHTTISLPNIHSLSWVPESESRFLVSGNNKGYAHLVSVPSPHRNSDGESDEDGCAEIVKRFNHRKHLKRVNKPVTTALTNTCISQLGFLSKEKLTTCFDDTLFVWDINDVELSVRPRPESVSVIPGIKGFDTSAISTSTLALCGTFGISLFDSRTAQHSIPNSSYAARPRKQMDTHHVKWHPNNSHIMATAHGDGVVRLWDIRKQDTFAELTGHKGKTITAMTWNNNDLFTGANNGHVVHWDLTSDLSEDRELSEHGDKLAHCSLKEGINSISFDAVKNQMVSRVSERQCGTTLPALNNKIVGLCPIFGSSTEKNDCNIILVDGAAFLGLHSKIYEAAAVPGYTHDKEFYTELDLALMSSEVSNETLVASSESLVAPLSIKRSPTLASIIAKHESMSGPTAIIETPEDVQDNTNDDIASSIDSGFHFDGPEWSEDTLVVSLHSIDSMPELQDSPFSLGALNNDSDYSISTAATVVGAETEVTKEDPMSFLNLAFASVHSNLAAL